MGKGTARTEGRNGVGQRAGASAAAARVVPRVSVRIRAAVQTDATALARLRRQSEDAHARLMPDYFRVASASAPSAAAAPERTSVILVAEGFGKDDAGGGRSRPTAPPVLGYVSVNLVDTPSEPTMTPRRRVHVDAVVVDEAHRGAGIGTALMRAASAWARRRDAVEVVLTVWSENEAALALYRRLGYEPVARVLRQVLDA